MAEPSEPSNAGSTIDGTAAKGQETPEIQYKIRIDDFTVSFNHGRYDKEREL